MIIEISLFELSTFLRNHKFVINFEGVNDKVESVKRQFTFENQNEGPWIQMICMKRLKRSGQGLQLQKQALTLLRYVWFLQSAKCERECQGFVEEIISLKFLIQEYIRLVLKNQMMHLH